jgi:hypothetical protein
MINYEIRRKIGLPLQDNEKYLLSILDSFQMELSSPINKEIQRQKLNEFVEMIKILENNERSQMIHNEQRPFAANSSNGNVNASSSAAFLDVNNLTDVQKALREQHKAFKSLIDIMNKDFKDLEIVKKGIFNEK